METIKVAAELEPETWPEDAFEPVNICPWCTGKRLTVEVVGARDWFFDAVPGSFDFARCEDCRSLILTVRPKPEYLPRAYENYYTHTEAENPGTAGHGLAGKVKSLISSAYIRSRYGEKSGPADLPLSAFYQLFPDRQREIDVHYRFLPSEPSRVLDYGCGNGSFLERAMRMGHNVFGVDFDPGAIEASARKGIDVVLPDDAEHKFQEQVFDYVSAAHVIEHVTDPKSLLADFRRWMKKGATLFLELPNADAAGLEKYGAFWRGLEAPRHFSLPNRATLRSTLKEIGFEDVQFHRRDVVAEWLWTECERAIEDHQPAEFGQAASRSGEGGEEFLTVTARAC